MFNIWAQCAYCVIIPFSDDLETCSALHIGKSRVVSIIIKYGFAAVGVFFLHYMGNSDLTGGQSGRTMDRDTRATAWVVTLALPLS